MAILHKKEETENTKISDDIINYIAENINTNIRELEGALNRITAFKLVFLIKKSRLIWRKMYFATSSTTTKRLRLLFL